MVCRLVAVQVKVVICSNCIILSDIVCRLAVPPPLLEDALACSCAGLCMYLLWLYYVSLKELFLAVDEYLYEFTFILSRIGRE
uniref:Uncharacterized protein n=1 Tax=Arundo donax TaxID=35708 RepID=A0A0A9E1S7_ARUDO